MSESIKLPTNTIFVGCTHLDHNKEFIWGVRGFTSVEQHNDFIVKEIVEYAKANPSATIVHLGDGFLNSTPERVTEYFRRLELPIYYIWGNHEGPTKQLYKKDIVESGYDYRMEIYPWSIDNVTFLGNQATFSIDKQSIFGHHFPLAVWNKSHHGIWHVHSHNHHTFPESHREYLHAKRLDVGVDSCLKYFSKPYITFSQLKKIMDNKNIHKVDHHGSTTT